MSPVLPAFNQLDILGELSQKRRGFSGFRKEYDRGTRTVFIEDQ